VKVITVEQFEHDFDAIMDDVCTNLEHYKILTESSAVMLIPVESYDFLKEVYKEWVDKTKLPPVEGFDPCQLPMEYIGKTEPQKL
jgi:hypothetical protein